MRIKRDVKFPPGGWIFLEPSTGWRAPYPMAHDRYQTAREIAKHRRSNPHKKLNPSEDAALADLETFTCHRIKNDPNYCEGGAEKKTPAPYSGAQQKRKALRERLAALVVGAETVRDWFGDGMMPVPFGTALDRSRICEGCPKNQKGDWLNRLTGPIANAVMAHLKAKTMLNLELLNEEQLGTCAACECQLVLKVWVPPENIDMSPETMARLHRKTPEYPFDCWILSEKEAVGGVAVP